MGEPPTIVDALWILLLALLFLGALRAVFWIWLRGILREAKEVARRRKGP